MGKRFPQNSRRLFPLQVKNFRIANTIEVRKSHVKELKHHIWDISEKLGQCTFIGCMSVPH